MITNTRFRGRYGGKWRWAAWENHTISIPPNSLGVPDVKETPAGILFHFEEQRVETLTAEVFILRQPSFKQTSKAKSVAYTHCSVTVQALVRLARARRE